MSRLRQETRLFSVFRHTFHTNCNNFDKFMINMKYFKNSYIIFNRRFDKTVFSYNGGIQSYKV